MNADRALNAYRQRFGSEPSILVRAPGRVNLIGEHTDYNDGFVLPCAIDRDTVVAAGPASDGLLQTIAADFANETDNWALGPVFAPAAAEWANYVRGTATALIEQGVSLPGAQREVETVRDPVARDYCAPDGSEAQFFVCKATDGAGPASG